MTSESTPSESVVDRDLESTPKSADMRQADTANGENPDDDTDEPSPATQSAENPTAHRTGERQARENLENDPPA